MDRSGFVRLLYQSYTEAEQEFQRLLALRGQPESDIVVAIQTAIDNFTLRYLSLSHSIALIRKLAISGREIDLLEQLSDNGSRENEYLLNMTRLLFFKERYHEDYWALNLGQRAEFLDLHRKLYLSPYHCYNPLYKAFNDGQFDPIERDLLNYLYKTAMTFQTVDVVVYDSLAQAVQQERRYYTKLVVDFSTPIHERKFLHPNATPAQINNVLGGLDYPKPNKYKYLMIGYPRVSRNGAPLTVITAVKDDNTTTPVRIGSHALSLTNSRLKLFCELCRAGHVKCDISRTKSHITVWKRTIRNVLDECEYRIESTEDGYQILDINNVRAKIPYRLFFPQNLSIRRR